MNYQDIFSNLVGYGMQTFASMSPFFWVLLFGGIIGYIYATMKSIIVTIVSIILVFTIFGATAISDSFSEVPIFSQFLYIVTLIGLALLVLAVVAKRRS